MKEKNKSNATAAVPGWYADTAGGDFEIGLDRSEKHSGTTSVYVKSVKTPKGGNFGNIMQWIVADEYRGKHLKMTAWVKTDIIKGTGNLWVRVDGEGHGDAKKDCFDNMGDRPIEGVTDWKQYFVVVDVPDTSSDIYFGCFLSGTGKLWLDDVSIESVSKDIPLTGNFTSESSKTSKKTKPTNLNFEADQ